MNSTEQTSIAIIADAHCHHMDSDYGLKATPLGGQPATLRSWQDSRRSSRVFNESVAALRTALDDIRQRGIRHVVLLGDYTDDGQREATARLRALLQDYREAGLAFYAIPGNHDAYASRGKHQSSRFVSSPQETVLVTSDPELAATEDNAILSPAMYCEGSAVALQAMADFGLCRPDDCLHWETPFGISDAIEDRYYSAHSADGKVRRQLVDASYLVEPVSGVWLLMIDANVFEPRNGQWRETQKKAFLDCSDVGWNTLLRNRAHLLPWISDVCTRARARGKQLLGFSHYPVMDPFDDQLDSEGRLFGQTSMRRRRPSKEVARALLGAGLQWHFGGHLHVNGYRRYRLGQQQLTDIAVPSTATFPAAYQIIHRHTPDWILQTVPLNDMPLNPALLDYYRREVRASRESRDTHQGGAITTGTTDTANPESNTCDDAALQASTYGDFLYHRMQCRVEAHHLPREWPQELALAMQDSNAANLATFLLAQRLSAEPLQLDRVPHTLRAEALQQLDSLCRQARLTIAELQACRCETLLLDWYCFRQAGHQACSFFRPSHLPVQQFLARQFGDQSVAEAATQADFLRIFLGVLHQCLQRSVPGSPLCIELDWQ